MMGHMPQDDLTVEELLLCSGRIRSCTLYHISVLCTCSLTRLLQVMGYVPQDDLMYTDLTAEELLLFSAHIHRILFS